MLTFSHKEKQFICRWLNDHYKDLGFDRCFSDFSDVEASNILVSILKGYIIYRDRLIILK